MVLVAGGLLGFVFQLNLLQPGQASSGNPLPSSVRLEDRWAAVMKELIGKIRHFKGSPDAPAAFGLPMAVRLMIAPCTGETGDARIVKLREWHSSWILISWYTEEITCVSILIYLTHPSTPTEMGKR